MIAGEWIENTGQPFPLGRIEVEFRNGQRLIIESTGQRATNTGGRGDIMRYRTLAPIPDTAPDIAPDYRETLRGAAALLQATAEVSDVRAVLATVEVVRGMLAGVVDGEG